MKSILLSALLLTACFVQAQNVGIGTTTPGTKLHIIGPDASASNTNATVEAISATAAAGLKLTTATVGADFTRYGSSSAVSVFGIPAANLARIFNIGPILVGASGTNKLYFGTNSLVRMTFDENGLGGINTSPISNVQLNMSTGLEGGLYVNSTRTTTQSEAVSGRIVHTLGAALSGVADVASLGTAPFENGAYGVRGIAGNAGIAGGFFSLAGTALRAKSTSGLSLHTTGNLRLTGIGEAAGRVLTTDASGNATWQVLPASSSPWTVSGNDIQNSNTGGVGVGVMGNAFSSLHVKRTDNASAAPGSTLGAIYGENGSTNNGSGLYGVSFAPRTGAQAFAGVSGLNLSAGTDMFGVIGQSTGTSSAGVPSAGVGGYGDYGVLGFSGSSTGAGVMAQSSVGKTALELNNGYIKVSGTNKAAFVHVANAGNSSAHITTLSYPDQAATDILIITQNWSAGAGGGFYNDSPVGVYWDGSHWTIFNEHTSLNIAGAAFNVMVIKQ